jgi:hypothetical protein
MLDPAQETTVFTVRAATALMARIRERVRESGSNNLRPAVQALTEYLARGHRAPALPWTV